MQPRVHERGRERQTQTHTGTHTDAHLTVGRLRANEPTAAQFTLPLRRFCVGRHLLLRLRVRDDCVGVGSTNMHGRDDYKRGGQT
jgi:hypothetical protein